MRSDKRKGNALEVGAASLSVPDGEVCHITITGRRLLTPLTKTLLELPVEGVCSMETALELVEDWRIPFLDFLEHGGLPDNPTQ